MTVKSLASEGGAGRARKGFSGTVRPLSALLPKAGDVVVDGLFGAGLSRDLERLGHAALGSRAHFVGSHPMAGSEKTGWQHSTETLFDGRTCFVTPLADTNENAAATVAKFWRELGGEPVTISPDQHDEIVAHISHLPQMIASSLCAFLAKKNPQWRNFAGGGLRDTTRIAGSDPQLWRTIIEQNRDEILRALREYQEELHAFQIALANRDYLDLTARLERGRAYRSEFRV